MNLSRATLEGWLAWRGRQAVDAAGRPLGQIIDIYLDRRLEQPTWALLDLGSRSAFAPLYGAAPAGAALRLGVDAVTVRKAPTAPAGRELSAPTEAMLRRHFEDEERGPRYAWEASSDAGAGAAAGHAGQRGASRVGASRVPSPRADASRMPPPHSPARIAEASGVEASGVEASRADGSGWRAERSARAAWWRRWRFHPATGFSAAVGVAALLALAIGVLLWETGPSPTTGTQPAGMVVPAPSQGRQEDGGPRDLSTGRRLRGGSFERGFDGWAAGPGATLERTTAGRDGWGVVARDARQGVPERPAGSRPAGTTIAMVGMVRPQVLHGVARGTRIRASAWVRVTEPGADVHLRLVEMRGGRRVAVDAKVVTVTDRRWRWLAVSGVLDAAGSDLDLQVEASGLGRGALVMDGVWLEVALP